MSSILTWDGYGNSTRRPNGELIYSFLSCVKPLGYIRYQQGDLLDCNDADIEVHPEGTIEHTHNLPPEEFGHPHLIRADQW